MAKPLPALDFLAASGKHAPRPICVLFGDEPFLKRLVLTEIRRAVLGDRESDSDFSYSTIEGDNAEWREIVDELSTVALFGGGQRLVVLLEADDFVSKNRPHLEDYAGRSKATGTLVLEVKTWPATTRLYKSLAESGLQIECKAPAEAGLLRWLSTRAAQPHKAKLEAGAAERLLEIVGPEMGLLDQELAKLSLLVGAGEKITAALIDDAVGGWRAKTAWDMLDAAADGHARQALEQLDRLLLSGENAIALLGQISFTLRRFAAATRLMDQAEAIGKRLALRQALEQAGFKSWPAALNKAEGQLRQIGRIRGRQLHHWLLETDLALKGVSSSPPRARLVLEQLIARLATQLGENRRPMPAER